MLLDQGGKMIVYATIKQILRMRMSMPMPIQMWMPIQMRIILGSIISSTKQMEIIIITILVDCRLLRLPLLPLQLVQLLPLATAMLLVGVCLVVTIPNLLYDQQRILINNKIKINPVITMIRSMMILNGGRRLCHRIINNNNRNNIIINQTSTIMILVMDHPSPPLLTNNKSTSIIEAIARITTSITRTVTMVVKVRPTLTRQRLARPKLFLVDTLPNPLTRSDHSRKVNVKIIISNHRLVV
mmetsp:Transcript_16697/g.34869  ORF Transcript_16697/g.34869 Transcript_16697/m.34869 type:complete len:242 (+) Transcript_16697:669-1394(+)